jgi:predicted ester cyclase
MAAHFHEGFRWIANTGCGVKNGIDEFRRNWQLPLTDAFSDRKYIEEARLAQGEWVAAFGYIDAVHSGEFMGIAPTGKRVKIKYTDFWKVRDGKIADNWVTVDFASVMAQLGVDVFAGEGWEKYDNGLAEPPVPGGS